MSRLLLVLHLIFLKAEPGTAFSPTGEKARSIRETRTLEMRDDLT